MVSDPISAAARAAAECLVIDYGPRLAGEVEAALHAPGPDHRREQYDPVSVASLIVSAASLAWAIYISLKKNTPDPSPKYVVHSVSLRLKDRVDMDIDPVSRDRVIEVVVTEVIRASDGSP